MNLHSLYQKLLQPTMAVLHFCPLKPENNYLIDLDAIPTEVIERARVIWVNYPNNPTGATAEYSFYEKLVDFARKRHLDCERPGLQ